MPKRDAQLLLQDMRLALERILTYTDGFSREQFLADLRTLDAVVRNLEILGEACRQMPAEILQENPQIPWRRIAGLRNRLAHEYFDLDYELIWVVVRRELPLLTKQLADVVLP